MTCEPTLAQTPGKHCAPCNANELVILILVVNLTDHGEDDINTQVRALDLGFEKDVSHFWPLTSSVRQASNDLSDEPDCVIFGNAIKSLPAAAVGSTSLLDSLLDRFDQLLPSRISGVVDKDVFLALIEEGLDEFALLAANCNDRMDIGGRCKFDSESSRGSTGSINDKRMLSALLTRCLREWRSGLW